MDRPGGRDGLQQFSFNQRVVGWNDQQVCYLRRAGFRVPSSWFMPIPVNQTLLRRHAVHRAFRMRCLRAARSCFLWALLAGAVNKSFRCPGRRWFLFSIGPSFIPLGPRFCWAIICAFICLDGLSFGCSYRVAAASARESRLWQHAILRLSQQGLPYCRLWL